ncbi:MAG: GNAT family N-acetyltransferase [Bdellovibrionales bacterium]
MTKSDLFATNLLVKEEIFDLQPNLRGSLLKLEPLKPQDFESLFLVASDPLIWQLHPEPTRYQRSVFEKFFDLALQSKGALLVRDLQSNLVLGSSRFYNLNLAQKRVTIGYTFLSRSCWGGQHNADMKRLMLTHAFQYVEDALFEVGESNWRSRRAMEKIGGRLCGRMQKQNLDGLAHVIYKISKEEFLQSGIA